LIKKSLDIFENFVVLKLVSTLIRRVLKYIKTVFRNEYLHFHREVKHYVMVRVGKAWKVLGSME